jgi:Tol biopolymer transport system component/imidazolonepropionase-like amidohydrolase
MRPSHLLAVTCLLGVMAAAAAPSRAATPPPVASGPGAPAPDTVRVTVSEGTSMSVSASPDGQRLVLDLQGSLWVLPVGGGDARRITDVDLDAREPQWSPAGDLIAFHAFRDGGYDLWQVRPDGSGLQQLTHGPFDDREAAWSPDGRHLALASDRGGSYDIWLLERSTGALRQATASPDDEFMPTFSPDGTAIAFVRAADRAGRQLVVRDLATGQERPRADATGRVDAPSWGGGGRLVHHVTAGGSSRLMAGETALTDDENAFAFRAGWLGPHELVYVADGRIRRRDVRGGASRVIPFTATLPVVRASYARRMRDVDARAPRIARGIVGPAISPDGRRIAFVALGDLYVSTDGAAPRNLTRDAALDADPAWSPDGRHLVWASDRAGGSLLDLWLYDTVTDESRRLTREATSAMAPAWSPDGRQVAFLDVDGIWRAASVAVVEVASGAVRTIHPQTFGPGAPTWSGDGRHVLFAALQPYATRFREGTNQVRSVPIDGGPARWHVITPHLSIDSRVGAGPVISPDGRTMAVVYEGQLTVVAVAPDGTPIGPPRRVTTELAHAPSWTRDGRTLLYQSNTALRTVRLDDGATATVGVPPTYVPAIPTARVVVQAGRLITRPDAPVQQGMDVEIVGHRIARIAPAGTIDTAGAQVVDARTLTVMPGLIEFHTHLQKDFGTNAMRAYLAFGVTTVRSPGSTPYEAIEDREAVEAGVRPGPRLFVTGYLMEWQRAYYKMAVAISSGAHLELELQRAQALGFDLLKSYVRMPDIQQRRIVEFAHAMGVPAASHEIYPAALWGMDGTEHTTGTSRRGYSTKAATLQRSYGDVAALFAASRMPITPTLALGGGGMRALLARDSALLTDPRFGLYPAWLRPQPFSAAPARDAGPGGEMMMSLYRAGTRVVAGTDTPNAATLHGELLSYVLAGMSPAEALATATVEPAAALGIDAGEVAPGRLADLVIVAGDPLTDITATSRVRVTIANGRVHPLDSLLPSPPPRP